MSISKELQKDKEDFEKYYGNSIDIRTVKGMDLIFKWKELKQMEYQNERLYQIEKQLDQMGDILLNRNN